MNGFESVFGDQMDHEEEFDTIFGSQDDGHLIDACCGFNEAGECETDFDELHQTDDDADPDELEDDVVGDETDNAPSGAEGTDSDPLIDLAMGECGDEFSANGCNCKSDADDFYPDDIRDEEEDSALTGEGRDVDMDEEDLDGEFDKMMEAVTGQADCDDDFDYEDDGLTGMTDECNESDDMDDFDDVMDNLGDDDDDSYDESYLYESDDDDEYEEGDADLVDLVAGD